jgi:hypothetical protein
VSERAPGENSALLESCPANGHSVDDFGVVARVNDDSNVVVVLGRRSNHGRTANVDVFDDDGRAGTARDRCSKWIQVDNNELERLDSHFRELGDMRVVPKVREYPRVNRWVQCLDTTVQ